MKENINNAIEYIKTLPFVRGCITGSCLLGVFEGEHQDVDVFLYDEKSFTEIFYAFMYNPMFTITDDKEAWKADRFRLKGNDYYKKGVQTIKFTYNTCIPINIILKSKANNVYEVLSSFDMDIVCKGIDLESKQILDLTGNSTVTKIASWNKTNTAFYDPEVWQISRILRQLERVIKYHKRGYNTDAVCEKYIDLIDGLLNYNNIFNSEKIKITIENIKTVKKICKHWLKTHEISEKQLELLRSKITEV